MNFILLYYSFIQSIFYCSAPPCSSDLCVSHLAIFIVFPRYGLILVGLLLKHLLAMKAKSCVSIYLKVLLLYVCSVLI